jgi:hypothetical protein
MTCPKCKRVGKGSGMIRYHFDNCKINVKRRAIVPGGQGKYQRLKASCVTCKKEMNTNIIKRYHGEKCKL